MGHLRGIEGRAKEAHPRTRLAQVEPNVALFERGIAQRAKQADQFRQLMMGIEPAGIGQQPECRLAQFFGLPPEHRSRPLERAPVGADPEHGHVARRVAFRFAEQAAAAGTQLLPGSIVLDATPGPLARATRPRRS